MNAMMKYRPLGRTGLTVSAIGLGAITGAGVEGATKIINESINLGVNIIDTSREYAHSEERIGLVLKERHRDLNVCTKTHKRDKNGAMLQIEESLANLMVDKIDIYMLHDVSGDEVFAKVMAPNGAFQALKEAKKSGKISHIGLSTHDLNTAINAMHTGQFEVIEIPFSAVESSEKHFKVIDLANELGIGILAMKPLSGGNQTHVELALRYILQYNISSAIPGGRKLDEAQQNALVGWDTKPLNQQELEVLMNEAKELGQTFCRRCGYCQPCTAGIDIPGIFIMDAQARAAIKRGESKILDTVRKGYTLVKIKADKCLEDGVCEERCPYRLPIIEMLKAARDRLML